MLKHIIDMLNSHYPKGDGIGHPLLRAADRVAASEGKKVWFGVSGWYADFPQNEKK